MGVGLPGKPLRKIWLSDPKLQAARAHNPERMIHSMFFRRRQRPVCGLHLQTWRRSQSKCSLRCRGVRSCTVTGTRTRDDHAGWCGSICGGFRHCKEGEGWYIEHSGSQYGFRADMWAHRAKGYGAVVMTNGTSGDALISRLREIIEQEFKWDTRDEPIPRRYGPYRTSQRRSTT